MILRDIHTVGLNRLCGTGNKEAGAVRVQLYKTTYRNRSVIFLQLERGATSWQMLRNRP